MGTSNFYYKNASKVFVISENYETPILDDELNETEETEIHSPDLMEFLDTISYIQEKLEEIENVKFIKYNDKQSQNENRNFPAHYIGTIYLTTSIGDITCEVNIDCFSRAGYYEAACLDWELDMVIDGCNFDDVDDVNDLFINNTSSYMNKGMLTIQSKTAEKWFGNTKDKLVKLVEEVFEQCSTSYKKLGTFSNGETIYEKCTKTRRENADKRGYYVSPEKIKKESKPVIQYDTNNNFIKEWDSIHEVSRVLKIGRSNITNVCQNKKKYKTAGGFIWKYKELEAEFGVCP